MIFVDEQTCKIKPEEEFNIYKVDDLKNDILYIIDTINKFEIDLSNVKEFDTSALQFLISIYKYAQDNEKEFNIIEKSETVEELFVLYNLKSYLE
jgi:anti-anti-sigma factor